GLVPMAALAALCGSWVRRHVARSGLAPGGLWSSRWALGTGPGPSHRARVLLVAGAITAAAVTFLVPYVIGLGAPDAIVQQWDAVFHASGVQLIRDSGNASVLGAMQGQYGLAAPG